MLSRRDAVYAALGLALLATPILAGRAGSSKTSQPAVFAGLVPGVAIAGHDAVAYFTERKPVRGSAGLTLVHQGATWRFASAQNRDAFKADPAKFAPQYGGYCAFAAAHNAIAKAEPDAWTIVDGKLYLNFSKAVQRQWEADPQTFIARANGHWPGVLEQAGR